MLQHEINLFLYRRGSSHHVLFHRFFESLEPGLGVVEILDGLMKLVGRIIGQQALEITKCYGALVEVFRFFHLVVAGGVSDKLVGSPVISLGIFIVRLAVSRRDHVQGLSVRISSVFLDLLS